MQGCVEGMFRKRLGCRKRLAGTEGAGVKFGPREASSPTLCDPMDSRRLVPLSMGFSRQEHWNRLPFSPPEDFTRDLPRD